MKLKKRLLSLQRNKYWIGWLLVAPVLLLRGFTTIFPITKTFISSLFDIRIFSGINEFVGIRNYLHIFNDSKIITSIKFTIIFVIVSMLLHIVLGVLLALILNMKYKGQKFRTIVLIPWAMPTVVIALAAKWAFNNDYGLINDFVRWFNPLFNMQWLINTNSARTAVIAVDLWKDIPFFAILVLSGLQFIPSQLYEASKVDGANSIQSLFYITLPLIFRNVITLCIPFTMWRLTTFDLVYAMTAGGPGEDTALIAYRITTEVFTNLNIGYGSTLAIYLFMIMAIFSLFNYKLIRRFN